MKLTTKNIWFLCFIILMICIISSVIFIRQEVIGHKFKCVGCNVILISLDALRADHLGIYGYERNTSPNIDHFAEQAYIFNNSISQSGITSLSVPSYLTSKLPITDGIVSLVSPNSVVTTLKEKEVTISEILKQNGYHTYAIMSYPVMLSSNTGVAQGFEIFDEKCSENSNKSIENCFADSTTERTIKLLNGSTTQPFFMWVYYREPHAPYNPPLRIFEIFNNFNQTNSELNETESREYWNQKMQYLIAKNSSKQINRTEYIVHRKIMHLDEEDANWLKNAYDANIYYVDEQIGILLDYLNKSGLMNKTVIIITSDHGELQGEHHVFDHGGIRYQLIHTPLIIYLPEHNGRTIDYPVSNLDIMPTILEIAGLKTNLSFRGKNAFDNNRQGYVQFAEINESSTIIKNGWKLTAYEVPIENSCNSKNRLFDIIRDPEENFGAVNVNTKICNQLKKAIIKIRTTQTIEINSSKEPDNETIEKLKALGYVN